MYFWLQGVSCQILIIMYFIRLCWILKNLIFNLSCTKCTIDFEKLCCRTPCIAEEGLKWLKNGRCMEFLIWKAIDETNVGCFYLNEKKMIRILQFSSCTFMNYLGHCKISCRNAYPYILEIKNTSSNSKNSSLKQQFFKT